MNNTKEVQAMQLPIQKLRPFENHPFQVKDDDEMELLVWSVLTQGVLRCSASAIQLCQRRLNSFGNPKRIFFDRKVKAISEIGQQLS